MKRIATAFFLLLLYAAPLVAQIPRTVLIEEATGTWCGYCPYGGDTLEAILSSMGNVRGLSYHGGSGSEPMQTGEGNTILANFPTSSWPSAAVDRMIWTVGTSQMIMLSRSLWRAAAVAQLTSRPTSPCSLTLKSTFDSTTRVFSGTVEVRAFVAMTGSYNVNIVLSEHNLNYPQTIYNPNTNILDPYYHKHVVRKMITGAYGVSLTTTGLGANQIAVKSFSYTLPTAWNINAMDVTVFVTTVYTGTNGTSREIQSTWQEGLRRGVTFTPVELVTFTADQTGADVQLAWRTARETQNAGWHVERRTLESDWQDVGFVPGAGTTTEERTYGFVDKAPAPETLYSYRLRQEDLDGTVAYSLKAPVFVRGLDEGFVLMQNFPNPFNPSTSIEYRLHDAAPVRVEILDVLGRTVSVLVDGVQTAGAHTATWDAVDASGMQLPSGVYLCRMTAPGFVSTRTMHLTR